MYTTIKSAIPLQDESLGVEGLGVRGLENPKPRVWGLGLRAAGFRMSLKPSVQRELVGIPARRVPRP